MENGEKSEKNGQLKDSLARDDNDLFGKLIHYRTDHFKLTFGDGRVVISINEKKHFLTFERK
jgi:hypothetical protein